MKSTIFYSPLLLFLFCNILFCPAQGTSGNCRNDSTVISLTFQNHDGDISYDETITAFDLDSGIASSTQNYYPSGGPWSGYSFGTSYWSKRDTFFTAFGAIQEILTSAGSPNGWVNSKSITYSYTATQKINIYAIRTWNGSSWDSLSKKTWQYNAQDLVSETALFQMQLGVWKKINMTQIAYTGNQSLSKTFLSGTIPGNIWKNDSLFEFTYTGNIRTQARVSYWDPINLIWLPFIQIPYQQFGDWAIRRANYIPKIVDGFLMYDTLYFDLDTLEATIFYRTVSFTNIDTLYDWIFAHIESTDSVRIDGVLKINASMVGDFFMETNVDSSWQGLNRPIVDVYYYDSFGRLNYIDHSGGYTNPSGGFQEFEYNSIGFMNYHHLNSWTMVTNNDYYEYYSYFDSSSVNIIKPLWDERPMVCPNSDYQPSLLVAGGCGPYQFHWYPSTGLSSDTVLNPLITVSDSINYTVIVNDNVGHTDTLLYSIESIYSVELLIDTSNCSGPAILSAIEYPYADYQWYNNGIIIPGEITFQLSTSQAGNYSVVISYGEYSTYSGYVSCTSSSDTVYISNLHTIYSTQQAEICVGNNYQLPDGVFVDSTGTYLSVLPTSSGCDSSITTILSVNNILVVLVTTSDISCFGGTSQVVIAASGGIGPYSGTGTFAQTAGTFTYYISDANGCESNQSITISQPTLVVANAGNSIALCPGTSTVIGGNPSGTGGTGTLSYQWFPSNYLSSSTISNPTATPIISTDYTVIVADSNGCSDSSIVSIAVGTNLTPVIQQIGDTLVALASGVNYEWWFNGALLLSGNYPYIIANNSGNYQVVFFDSLGCSGTSLITPVIVTGIEEISALQLITVFPNPASYGITIELPANMKDVLCSIYDLSGRKIFYCKLQEQRNQISIAVLSSGVYTIGLIGEGFSGYKRLIIEK